MVWRSLRTKIESVLDQIAPVKVFKFRNTKPGWLSDDLIEMMHDRDVALKRARKSKKPEEKRHARSIRNLVNHFIKQARSSTGTGGRTDLGLRMLSSINKIV